MNCDTDFLRPKRTLNDTTLLGTCEWRQVNRENQTPLEALDEAREIDDLKDVADSLTGFFGIVTQLDDSWAIVPDCINSIPLYFTEDTDGIYVTDSQQQLLNHCETVTADPVSVAEYENVAYVTTNSLLYESMYQSEAATIVQFSTDEIETCRYFNYEYADEPHHRSTADLEQIINKVVQRCIDYADGRQIWIPLSGGFDSRLLLTTFVNLGYENIHTYTYGSDKSKNSEPAVAQRVAQSLDVDWHFFEYTPEQWSEWYQTEDRYEYDTQLFLSTVPMLKELPGIQTLLDKGYMNDNAVIVPGHSGLPAGGQLATYLYNRNYVSDSEMAKVTLTRHYIDGFNSYNKKYQDGFISRILNSAQYSGGSGIDAIEACERWNWRERQSTWLLSHLKQYEFYDLDWWIPLWDRDFVEFWMETNIKQRFGKLFYEKSVQLIYESTTSDPEPARKKTITDKMKLWAAGTRAEPYLRHFHRYVLNRKHPDPEDVYGWREGIVDYETFEDMFNGDTSARSYRARLILDERNVC